MTAKLFRTISFAIIFTLCGYILSVSVSVSSTVGSKSKQFTTSSQSMSSSISMVNSGGQTFLKSAHSELYKDKFGNNPTEVRAYQDSFEKQNNNPGQYIRQADTNVLNEKRILGNQPTITLINNIIDDAFDDVRSFYLILVR